jgi:LuxR family maltose regulon positive regulatory protein
MRPDAGAGDQAAKFSAPVATHIVPRPRLQALLPAGLGWPVPVVAATAGWGKTLLVGSWLANGVGERSSAWVSLDAGDDDPIAFWFSLATALLPDAEPAVAEGLRTMIGGGAHAGDFPGLLAAALRSGERPVVLVLDNLHVVSAPEVHAGLLRLIERPLPGLSFLVTTRIEPPWPLQRLRLAGLMAEVRASDLAFRPEEAAGLFGSLGLDLDATQVEQLIGRTEGWAAGLRLFALALQGSEDVAAAVEAFSGDDHSVAGYLISEVLDAQAPALVSFLERISVVDLVSADLADALTGRTDGAVMLAELTASHLFLQAVGRPGRWYRLHRLIIDLLRARPMSSRQRRDLHRRAAEWYRRHAMPLDALQAAVRGGLWDMAAELSGAYIFPLVTRGGAAKVERLLAHAPQAEVISRPELATCLAAARVTLGSPTELDVLIQAASTGARELSTRRSSRLPVVLDLVVGVRARVTGDIDRQFAALRRVPVDPVVLASLGFVGAEIVPVIVRGNRGTAALWTGDLQSAERDLAAVGVLTAGSPTLPHVNACGYLALLHCERGELDLAESIATEVVAAASSAGYARAPQVVGAYLAMARVQLDRGGMEAVDPWLSRVADVQSVASEPQVELAAALVLAAVRAAAGDRERAFDGLRATVERLSPWTPPRVLAERLLLAEAELLARSGSVSAAEDLLRRATPPTSTGALMVARVNLLLGRPNDAQDVLSTADVARHQRARVDAGVVGALVAAARDDEQRALDRLEGALLSAAPHGLRRPFLTEASGVSGLLQRRLDRGTAATSFALDLLQRMSSAVDPLDARRTLVDPLTGRERTVLRFLASTLSNAEIAGDLYVSVNTVKTHQRAIYRKLAADGRRDAVRRARALKLI